MDSCELDMEHTIYGRPYKFVRIMQRRTQKKSKKLTPSTTKCSCKEQNQRCSPTTCANALQERSCTPQSCSWCASYKGCNNRYRYVSFKATRFRVIDSKNNIGKGLVCKDNINKGDFVISYIGELYHTKDPKWQKKKKAYCRSGVYYMMDLGNGFIIDAYTEGNHASFINHSCDPNCRTQVWNHQGYQRVFIFANQYISAGTELTYSYHFDYRDSSSYIKCQCGADDQCSGVMGISKARLKKNKALRSKVQQWRSTSSSDNNNRKNESKKKKKKKRNSGPVSGAKQPLHC